MSRVSLTFVVLLSALAAGCSATRDNVGDIAVAQPATVAPTAPVAPAATQPTVVDGNELAQRELPICREILKSNSNVHVRQCMSAADWRRWERQEADRAEETVRMLQGSRYR